jgi:hypothetical protein
MALGVLRHLRERGLRVPEDVSVVGYDNIHLSEFSYPPLTTVNVPRDRIGHSVCSALLPERGASSSRDEIIQPELIVRDSTGRAAETQATLAMCYHPFLRRPVVRSDSSAHRPGLTTYVVLLFSAFHHESAHA